MSASSVPRQMARESAEASKKFFVVRFHEDQYIAVTPGKAIDHPPPNLLCEASECKIHWSNKKLYDATALAIAGKRSNPQTVVYEHVQINGVIFACS